MWHDEFQAMKMPKALFGSTANVRYLGPLATIGLSAGASALTSGLLSKNKKPKLLMLPEQYQAYQSLLPAATEAGRQLTTVGIQPYARELTAPLSEYESLGLKGLGEYLTSPLPTEGKLFGLSGAELEKTLGGTYYDPATGPYYEAYRTNVMRQLQQAKDRIAHRTSGADAFFGGGRLGQEREFEEGAMGSLAQVLGQLYEAERQRRLETVPLALQTMGWAEQIPQSRIAASQQFGALPRLIDQAELTARYQDFIRQLQMMGKSLDEAVALAKSMPEYWMPQPADTTGMANALGQAALLATAR